MSKSILISIIISFLAVTFVAAQGAFTPFEGTSKTYQVNNHPGSSYQWSVYSEITPLTPAAPSTCQITGNGTSQITAQWKIAGDYFLLVTETDGSGCTNLKAIRITVLPNNFKASFAQVTSSACYQTDPTFALPIRFLDGNGEPLGSSHFPMQVSFQVNGVDQPAQTLSFTNQNLSIAGSSFNASPTTDTPVTVKITGVTDALNLTIQTEANSAQHTRTILNELVRPTVTALSTNDTTPAVTGTATIRANQTLTVTLNNITYTSGNSSLVTSGSNWTLNIPANQALPVGVYEVKTGISNGLCSLDDVTSNELTIKEVENINDRIAINDINLTFKNSPVAGQVLINDAGYVNANPTVTIPSELKSVNGTIKLGTNGSYLYSPKSGFTGTDNFYYTVCTTENPAECDTVNVTIQVLNDVLSLIAPVAIDDEMQTIRNNTVSGNVLVNDLSVSGEKLILNVKPKDGPKSGTLVLKPDGSYTYTPKPDFAGHDYFVYEICGNVSGICAQAKATILVSNNSDETVLFAADDAFFSYGKTIQGNLLANDLYPKDGAITVSQNQANAPVHGTVTVNNSGKFTYTPQPDFAGTDQFVYQICDSKTKVCRNATVYLLIKSAPLEFADLSIHKEGPATVIPGGTITYQLSVTNLGTATATQIQINDYLSASVLNARYQSAGSSEWKTWNGFFDVSELGVQQSINLTIAGNVAQNARDTIKNMATVTSLSWDPVAGNNVATVNTVVLRGPVARIAGAPYLAVGSCNTTGKVIDASKSTGDGLSFSWSPTAYLDNPTSSKPVYRPGQTTHYKLTVTDANGQKDTTSVLMVVTPAPKAVTDRNVFVDKPNTTILLNGSKSTGAGLSFLWTSKEGIILSGETTPSAQVSGLGMYYLQVTDSLGCFNRDSVNVGLYIQAINDTAETKVNESVEINVLRNDIPKKSVNPSTISIVTPPLHGIASVSADSLILYLPEESYIGQDEFVYAVCDYFKNCDQAKVLVLVNDHPFFIPEAFSPNGDGINDKFEIKGLFKYQTVEIEIFNRWGNLVYQSKNYSEGAGKSGFWDGTAQRGVRTGSGPVPTGTYFYILRLNGKENINGSIYLDR